MPSPNSSLLTPNSSPLTPNSSLLTPHCLLITGGCGFIGTSLIKHLLENNQAKKIRVLDNLSVGIRDDLATVCDFSEVNISSLSKNSSLLTPHSSLTENSSLLTPHSSLKKDSSLAPQVELVVGDIRDAATAEACCQDMDIVVHLAANTGVAPSVENPRLDMECNVIGTLNMLEGARMHKAKRFIFASSGAPVGECEPPIHEELAPHPVSPYGASKLAGEGYCSAYFKTFGLKTVSLRFGNVYGPGSGHKNSVVAKFIRQALNGKTLEIYGDGNQTRDFIYIDDLIQAICLAINPSPPTPDSSLFTPNFSLLTPHSSLKKGSSLLTSSNPWGEVFQIATYKETTVNEIAQALNDLVESETGVKVNIVYGKPRLGDVRRNFSDTSKAQRLLGWEAEVELAEGLERTAEWFMSALSNQTDQKGVIS